MSRGIAPLVAALAALLATGSVAEGQEAGGVTPVFSVRARAEAWDWFDTSAAESYAYPHALVRFGLERVRPKFGWRVELAAPVILALPDDATQGHGAAYYRANDRRRGMAGLFPKQAFVTFGSRPHGHSARVGRFEFSEGGEVVPPDAGLAAVKRASVVQRLIGPFGFTEAGRSLDGVEYGWRAGGVNVSLLGAVPTVGVFNLDGLDHLSQMPLGYAGVTRSTHVRRAPGEWRLLAVGVRDARGLVPVDNRPLSVRDADRGDITVMSAGGHLLQLVHSGAGPFDVAIWAVRQFGAWGTQRHSAWAADLELGWRPDGVPWRPWLRAGAFRSSGDRNPLDDTHGTFYQTLATPRLFARFPFYNLTNVRDRWASVSLRPAARLLLRGDVRWVGVSENTDGWYQGSGPFDRSVFGLGYRPAGARRDIATLLDLSADWTLSRRTTVSAYAARALPGPVIGDVAAARFAFVEIEYRY